jgi:hypothetical protein
MLRVSGSSYTSSKTSQWFVKIKHTFAVQPAVSRSGTCRSLTGQIYVAGQKYYFQD